MGKAIRIHELGGPEVLRFEEWDIGDPGPGEAQVRHTAIGLNFIDCYHRTGVYPVPELPITLGVEGAGIVEAVGEGVTEVAVGDRVGYVLGPLGADSELRNYPAWRLVKLPDGVSDEMAAALLIKGTTVEYLLRHIYPLKAGETVLLHAAAGGVGLIFCQWAKHIGARVIGTVSSEEKAEVARAHGCAETIIYTKENFVERLLELNDGKKVPVVFDSIGQKTFTDSLDCLAPHGLMVTFGQPSGPVPPVDIYELASRGALFLVRPSLYAHTSTRDQILETCNGLFDMIKKGVVHLDINHRFALKDTAEAHKALEARQTVGPVLLIP